MPSKAKQWNGRSGQAAHWVSAYIFHSLPFEKIIAEWLSPFLEYVTADHKITHYFFIRYWERGAHLRVRLLLPDVGKRSVVENHLLDSVQNYFKLAGGKEHQHRVEFATYQPEWDRYGGRLLMPVAEQHFVDSSKVVAELIRENYEHWDYALAMGIAIQMQVLFAQALFTELPQSAGFFQFYFQHWLPCSLKGRADGNFSKDSIAKTIQHFENSFQQQKEQIAGIVATLRRNDLSENWQSSWYCCCQRLKGAIDQEVKPGAGFGSPRFQISDELPLDRFTQGGWSILESLVHMTNNRLGIDLRDEAFLAYLLAKSLTASPAP
jgi:thiopeptide-type bacteriocin biosynthesis protein